MVHLRDIQKMIAVAYCTTGALFKVLKMSYPKGTAYFSVKCWMYLLSMLLLGALFHNHSTLDIYKTLFVVP